jgi:hypothetical protein
MRWLLVAVALVGCSKKESSDGLPAADNWNADQAANVDPKSKQPAKSPHGSFHGSTDPSGSADPNDPHAGLGVDPNNPHGNVDPTDPSATMGMGDSNPHQQSGGAPMVEKTAPKSLDKLPDGRYVLGPLGFTLPDGWALKPVTSSMRSADFTFGDGEMIVFYFGTSGAGSNDDNINRWLGFVTPTGGKQARDVAKIDTKVKVNGQDATVMTVTGHYSDPGMMGSPPVDIVDGGMLCAIIPSTEGPYYFKGFGPEKTLEANAAKFRAMLASMKPR